jgi:hypothetical protein
MGKTVMHKNAARQREHLGLVLQPAEGCRENETVIIPEKSRAVILMGGLNTLHAQTLCRNKSLPIHYQNLFVSKLVVFQIISALVGGIFVIFAVQNQIPKPVWR